MAEGAVRLRVWVLVDMLYQPRPIAVDASANRDKIVQEAFARNTGRVQRFKVYTASFEVSLP